MNAPDSAVAARYVSLILQYEAVSLADVYEARTVLEAPAAARLAARPDHVTMARRLRAYLDEAGEPEDLAGAVVVHAGFQRLVVELAGNRTIALLSGMLESLFAEAAGRYVLEHETPLTEQKRRRADRAHRRLVELVRRRRCRRRRGAVAQTPHRDRPRALAGDRRRHPARGAAMTMDTANGRTAWVA